MLLSRICFCSMVQGRLHFFGLWCIQFTFSAPQDGASVPPTRSDWKDTNQTVQNQNSIGWSPKEWLHEWNKMKLTCLSPEPPIVRDEEGGVILKPKPSDNWWQLYSLGHRMSSAPRCYNTQTKQGETSMITPRKGQANTLAKSCRKIWHRRKQERPSITPKSRPRNPQKVKRGRSKTTSTREWKPSQISQRSKIKQQIGVAHKQLEMSRVDAGGWDELWGPVRSMNG